jgi:hypothetical protein
MSGRVNARGDLLVDDECRLVRIVELISVEQPARMAALARVAAVGATEVRTLGHPIGRSLP